MYSIKQVSEMVGISTDTLRYYESKGLLSPQRKNNAYRSYSQKDLRDIQYITVLKYAQFSLAEIQQIVSSLDVTPTDDCNQMNRKILSSKKDELEQRVQIYTELIESIASILKLIGNDEAYLENETEIYGQVQDVFQRIQESREEVL